MIPATGDAVFDDARRRIVLGKLVKSGGAGSVFLLPGVPRSVAKIYHANVDHATYARKVEAMLRLSPDLPEIVDADHRTVQIAWPSSLLRDQQGRFVGFLMPALDVDATSELEMILQEKQARAARLPTGLGPKVTLAANLAAVVAALHAQHHYIVDLKPVNLRFHRASLYMALLDCDGFSIQGAGERFPAPQFTPDYLAPEFQRSGITTEGEQTQDRFALAVVIFQLLNFGIHPFSGRPQNPQVPTDIPGRIAGRFYAYGATANRAIAPSPVSGHARMPAELRALFDRAFESRGHGRPSPSEWQGVLESYARRSTQRMVVCAQDSAHQHFAGMACAQCDRAQLLRKARAAQPPRSAVNAAAAAAARKFRQRATYTGLGVRRPAAVRVPLPLRYPLPPMPLPRQQVSSGAGSYLKKKLREWVMVLLCSVIFIAVMHAWHGISPTPRPVTTRVHARAVPKPTWKQVSDAPPPLQTIVGDTDWIEATASLAAEPSADVAQYVLALRAQGLKSRMSPAMAQSLREAMDRFSHAAADADSQHSARAALKASLSELLWLDQRAGPVAFELGLLGLIEGDQDAALRAFQHAIAVAPGDPAGWYGLAATKGQYPQEMYGALSLAEALATEEEARALRARMAETRLSAVVRADALAAIAAGMQDVGLRPLADREKLLLEQRRYAVILARAQVRVAKQEGFDPPPEVKALAAQPLPQ